MTIRRKEDRKMRMVLKKQVKIQYLNFCLWIKKASTCTCRIKSAGTLSIPFFFIKKSVVSKVGLAARHIRMP